MTPNTQALKARDAIRELMAAGWNDEALILDAAAEAIGGTEDAKLIVMMVWRKRFSVAVPN